MKSTVIYSKQRLSCYRNIAVGFIALLVVSLMVTPGCSSTGLKAGNTAPDFNLIDIYGNQIRLSDMRGKVVFLNFWETHCPTCVAEMPDMETLYQKYKDQDVVIIGVNLREGQNTVRQFVEQKGYSWTFVLDKTGEVSYEYEIKRTPTSFFLDKEGIIRAVKVGPMSIETMESNLVKAINKG